MQTAKVSKTIQLPDDVEATLEGHKLTIKGPNGAVTRDFSHAPVSIKLEGRKIHITAEWPRKKESALVGTLYSHIQNMITGVRKGFTCRLKIVFSHFPISVKVKDRKILIENFTGERSPRIVKILGDAQVEVESEDIVVKGINLEDVSQTSANIEQGTKLKRKDPRVFLDGIYITESVEGMEK